MSANLLNEGGEMAKEVKPDVLTPDMEKFLEIFSDKAGNIAASTEAMGISRRTYYNWRDSNKAFRERCEDVREELIDYAESKLMINIKEGKEASIFFLLKTLGKHRGYVERQEMEHTGHINFQSVMERTSLRRQEINEKNVRPAD